MGHALPKRSRSPMSNLVSAEPLLIWEYFELPSEISGERADYFLETVAGRQSPTAKIARNERVFHDSLEGASGDRTGWLGRQDSNLGMAEGTR